MGGDAGASSAPGTGSTFWFTARLSPGQPAATKAAPVELGAPDARLRLHRNGARVLVAEDDATNREVARELLEGIGFVVDAVPDGERALEMYSANDYDLVLMDVQMPGLDGLAATRAIRLRTDRPRVPVLAMTANVYAEDRRACADAGMDDFVAKPVNPDALYAILAHWLLPRGSASTPDAVADSRTAPAAEPGAAGSPIEDVDWARGVQRMSGDAAKYRRLLHLFADTHGDDERAIAASLARDDRKGLRRQVHALKGRRQRGRNRVARRSDGTETAIRGGAGRPRSRSASPRSRRRCRGLIAAIRRAPTPRSRRRCASTASGWGPWSDRSPRSWAAATPRRRRSHATRRDCCARRTGASPTTSSPGSRVSTTKAPPPGCARSPTRLPADRGRAPRRRRYNERLPPATGTPFRRSRPATRSAVQP
ncbi:MAG: response regulator [Betaproteobacteria bacterium]|nr:response regulator [Betaproteobacteria bacterium]